MADTHTLEYGATGRRKTAVARVRIMLGVGKRSVNGKSFEQYFSTPASARVHGAEGEPPSQDWSCEDEAAKHPVPAGYYDG